MPAWGTDGGRGSGAWLVVGGLGADQVFTIVAWNALYTFLLCVSFLRHNLPQVQGKLWQPAFALVSAAARLFFAVPRGPRELPRALCYRDRRCWMVRSSASRGRAGPTFLASQRRTTADTGSLVLALRMATVQLPVFVACARD